MTDLRANYSECYSEKNVLKQIKWVLVKISSKINAVGYFFREHGVVI